MPGAIAGEEDAIVRHVKPHGALYNMAAKNVELARAIARAVHDIDPALAVVGLAGSVSLNEAAALGLKTIAEAFVDRAYRADGSLVPRSEPSAVLHDLESIVRQARRLAIDGVVETVDGISLALRPETLCLHGDTPGALIAAEAVNNTLRNAGLKIVPR
ncbi:MAG: LamB/YcsF family protein [Pirellulales bacterium]